MKNKGHPPQYHRDVKISTSSLWDWLFRRRPRRRFAGNGSVGLTVDIVK